MIPRDDFGISMKESPLKAVFQIRKFAAVLLLLACSVKLGVSDPDCAHLKTFEVSKDSPHTFNNTIPAHNVKGINVPFCREFKLVDDCAELELNCESLTKPEQCSLFNAMQVTTTGNKTSEFCEDLPTSASISLEGSPSFRVRYLVNTPAGISRIFKCEVACKKEEGPSESGTTRVEKRSRGCSCGKIQTTVVHDPRARIVGGSQVRINQHPWQGALLEKKKNTNTPYCGATLISDRWVITAAHCTERKSPNVISVVLGEHDHTKTDESEQLNVDVAEIIAHPDFDSWTISADYALLRLQQPVNFDKYHHIRPVCLPQGPPPVTGDMATVSGWGATDAANTQRLSNTLQEVEVQILDQTKCQGYYTYPITSAMFCAGWPGGKKDSCQGDSGGPLAMERSGHHELVGVVSWGIGCAVAKQPGVYANVSFVMDWVKMHVGYPACSRS